MSLRLTTVVASAPLGALLLLGVMFLVDSQAETKQVAPDAAFVRSDLEELAERIGLLLEGSLDERARPGSATANPRAEWEASREVRAEPWIGEWIESLETRARIVCEANAMKPRLLSGRLDEGELVDELYSADYYLEELHTNESVDVRARCLASLASLPAAEAYASPEIERLWTRDVLLAKSPQSVVALAEAAESVVPSSDSVRLLLIDLARSFPDDEARCVVVESLREWAGDPSVEAFVENLARDDPSPRVRDEARNFLRIYVR